MEMTQVTTVGLSDGQISEEDLDVEDDLDGDGVPTFGMDLKNDVPLSVIR